MNREKYCFVIFSKDDIKIEFLFRRSWTTIALKTLFIGMNRLKFAFAIVLNPVSKSYFRRVIKTIRQRQGICKNSDKSDSLNSLPKMNPVK